MALTCMTALKKQVFPKFIIPFTAATLLAVLPFFFSPVSHFSSPSFTTLANAPTLEKT